MDTSKIDQLKELIKELSSLSEEELNEEQFELLSQLQEEPYEANVLNALLKNEKTYEGLEENYVHITELNNEEWNQYFTKDLKKKTTAEQKNLKQSESKSSAFINVIYFDVEFLKNDFEIVISLRKPDEPVPAEIGSFIQVIHEVQATINELYTDLHRRTLSLRKLEGIARVGGVSSFVDLAKQQLEQFKIEIVLQKGSEIKLKYLKELGLAGMAISALCGFFLMLPSVFEIKYQYESIFQNGLVLIIGSCIGTWLSFAIRKKEILFEDLRLLSGKNRSPLIRLLVLVFIAISFYFMFITSFLNVEIGESFSTGLIGNNGYESLAFLIGIFIGLVENSIGPTLTSRIETFTSKL